MPPTGAHLVQILLPLRDGDGTPFPRAELDAVREELTERFGGVTAYLQAPAAGAWAEDGRVERDEVVLVEVMVERLEQEWWRAYRVALEARFRQDELVVRALSMERI